MKRHLPKSTIANICLIALASLSLICLGCSGPTLVPVEGKVLFNGEPLKFGSVMFQPPSGQPATGQIQPDGTFSLETRGVGPGAVVGTHRVRITCYESQNPEALSSSDNETTVGESLIPKKYTSIDTSGFTMEIPPEGKTDIVFTLEK